MPRDFRLYVDEYELASIRSGQKTQHRIPIPTSLLPLLHIEPCPTQGGPPQAWTHERYVQNGKAMVRFKRIDPFEGTNPNYIQVKVYRRRDPGLVVACKVVRCERLQDITDPLADGVIRHKVADEVTYQPIGSIRYMVTARDAFAPYWNANHPEEAYRWEANPWVNVIEIRRT